MFYGIQTNVNCNKKKKRFIPVSQTAYINYTSLVFVKHLHYLIACEQLLGPQDNNGLSLGRPQVLI